MKHLRQFAVPALFLFAACSTTPTTTTPVNTTCPISGDAVSADAPTATFEGKTVGFCCKKCAAGWDKLAATEQKAKLTAAMPMK